MKSMCDKIADIAAEYESKHGKPPTEIEMFEDEVKELKQHLVTSYFCKDGGTISMIYGMNITIVKRK